MKRLLLIAIVLFPVVVLALWVYYGTTIPRVKPAATNSIATNSPVENHPDHQPAR